MEYYSNTDKTKFIATNKTMCAILTKSGICYNASIYTFPYRKNSDEQLVDSTAEEFMSCYDQQTAMMVDFTTKVEKRGVAILLPEAS